MSFDQCLLCNHARCAKACDKMEPDRLLRSLYLDNRAVVEHNLPDPFPCVECDASCEEACPIHLDIRDSLMKLQPKKSDLKLDYDVLRCDFCGIPLENPFFLSSSIVASSYDMCARAFEAGWAGVAYKTICLMDIEEASPRYAALQENNRRIIGFKNIEQLSEHTVVENVALFKRLKNDYPDKFLLVSIMGRNDEEWAYLADLLNDSGADALELNFSCPNMTEKDTGSDIGQIPELVERYCKIVKQHTKLPFIAKLTPNVTHIEESAEAAMRGGANGVCAINTIKSLIEVDINPKDGIFRSAIGGYSGKAIKPIALRFISELAKDKMLEHAHISATGGVETWRDALEFIVLGADTIQVTTAVMQYGNRIIDDLKSGLTQYLLENGYHSINELKKATLKGVVPSDELDRSYIIYPKFLHKNCVGCERCYLSCRDGGHQAISMNDGRPTLNPQKCVGCHLCVLVCPQKDIVSSGIPVAKNTIRRE